MTQFSNFAVRILMYAALHGRRPSPVPRIAEAYCASYDHMKKAAAELCRLSYLDSVRGRSGGVRLARLPAEINIGAVVRATEGTGVLVECFAADTNTCPLDPACKLKKALEAGVEAFFRVLDEYTLADLIAAPEDLAALLGLASTRPATEAAAASPPQ